MAKPESPNNPPTPENSNNSRFSIEVRNCDVLFSAMCDKQFRKKFEWDEKNNTGHLGDVRIEDGFVENGSVEIIGSRYRNGVNQYEYCGFCPILKIKRKVLDKNYNLVDERRYLKKEIAIKTVEILKNKGENASYYINPLGRQTIFIENENLTYIVNCGFMNEEDHLKSPYPLLITNPKDYEGTITYPKIDILCLKINKINKEMAWSLSSGHPCIPFKIQEFCIDLGDEENFKKNINTFLKKCETIISCLNEAYEEKDLVKKIMIDCMNQKIKNEEPLNTKNSFSTNEQNILYPPKVDKLLKSSESNDKFFEDRETAINFHINNAVKEICKSINNSVILFSPDLKMRTLVSAFDGLNSNDIKEIIDTTIKTKIATHKLKGTYWTPIKTTDIIETLLDFNIS